MATPMVEPKAYFALVPDLRYKRCRNCGKTSAEVGPLSWTRQCLGCGMERLTENIIGLAEHKGEPMQRWRHGMTKCAGGYTLDEVKAAVQAALDAR